MSTRPQHERIEGATVADALARFEAAGYASQFGPRPDGEVMCFTCRETVDARQVELHELWRTEGASDPSAMAAVAAVECPRCHARGTLVLTYGPAGAPEDGTVLRRLEDLRARTGILTPPSE